ncbi:PEGA domain-containing protein [[Clostridium] colinum]|uniref:PEGA domain-containing protein n=1 Tax=[Clostridium] colinum TaxID=36835 RepID=UPI002025823D|nr:PEGA domain-containing protein [[Clostridium] colinum]
MNNKTKKSFNDMPLTDLDYKGVIYEPSKEAKNFKKNKKNIKFKENADKPKAKIKKAPSFNFNLFLGLTISIGIAIFVIVTSLTYSSISSYVGLPKADPNQNSPIISNNNNELILNSNTNKNILGVIKNINYETNLFTLTDINTNKNYTLKSKSSTIFKDKYGNMLTMLEIKKGAIVDFSFDDKNQINYINENSDAFLLENISNVKIDNELKTLKVNDKMFKINNNAIVVKNNEPYELTSISPLDVIDIKGYNDTVYFIELKKGNGTLKLENKPNLNKSIIEIDRDIFKSLDEINSINLPEGKHKVVIRSNDTLSFVKEIEILSGKETILDLSQIQSKSGKLFIKSNVTDYTLYVNDNIESSSSVLTLPYGTYNIKIEKEGYTPFQTQISINSPQYNLNVSLEKIEKVGKIIISSTPDNAEVFVNNMLVGYTPLTYKLPQGVHTITLKKQGYNDFVLSSVTIGEEESSFNITMHKSQNESSNTTNNTTSDTTTSTSSTEAVITEPTI